MFVCVYTTLSRVYHILIYLTRIYIYLYKTAQIYFEFFFHFLAAPCGTWDINSLTTDQTYAPCSGSMES